MKPGLYYRLAAYHANGHLFLTNTLTTQGA